MGPAKLYVKLRLEYTVQKDGPHSSTQVLIQESFNGDLASWPHPRRAELLTLTPLVETERSVRRAGTVAAGARWVNPGNDVEPPLGDWVRRGVVRKLTNPV